MRRGRQIGWQRSIDLNAAFLFVFCFKLFCSVSPFFLIYVVVFRCMCDILEVHRAFGLPAPHTRPRQDDKPCVLEMVKYFDQ